MRSPISSDDSLMLSYRIIRLARSFSSVRFKACIFSCFLALSASAQLPRVQLPPVNVPGVQVPAPDVSNAVGGTLRELAGARALRIERLAGAHRAELDRDTNGEL